MPAAPPTLDSSIDSVSSWRTIRPRPAPRTTRMRELLLARLRAREQQVRDVGARDQQHRADGQQQHEQRRTHVAEHFERRRHERQAELRVS